MTLAPVGKHAPNLGAAVDSTWPMLQTPSTGYGVETSAFIDQTPKHPQYTVDDLDWYVLQGEVFSNSARNKSLGLLRFPAQPASSAHSRRCPSARFHLLTRAARVLADRLIVVSSAKSVKKISRASKGLKRSTRRKSAQQVQERSEDTSLAEPHIAIRVGQDPLEASLVRLRLLRDRSRLREVVAEIVPDGMDGKAPERPDAGTSSCSKDGPTS
ncbi:hypothetical protein FOZ60_012772 [Perkinsus olseni]|uniref:Uncharacterized protein n=1 Tax=Perkinsus olseni TaxID=32597 RepID=A0A7J6NAR1_PEROL|nr:hypothetical protein FOZ60_012772 [Perkinsus olseni]